MTEAINCTSIHATVSPQVQLIIYWHLVGIFTLVLIASVIQAIRYFKSHKRRSQIVAKVIHVLIPIGLTAHLVYWASHPDRSTFLTLPVQCQDTPWPIIFGGLPNFIYFSTYILLVLFWLFLLYRSQKQTTKFISTLKTFYVITNVVVYVIWLSLMACILFNYYYYQREERFQFLSKIHTIEVFFSGSLYLVTCTSFCIFGLRLYYNLTQSPLVITSRVASKIGVISVICTISFGVRGSLLFVAYFLLKTEMENLIITFVLLTCEVAPIIVILVLLRRKSSTDPSQDTPLLQNEK